MDPDPSTPICPFCGAKHSHDRMLQRCKKCGLPDEVRDRGAEAIQAWDKQTAENKRLFGRQHARVEHEEQGKPRRKRARNKHGRRGVKHAAR